MVLLRLLFVFVVVFQTCLVVNGFGLIDGVIDGVCAVFASQEIDKCGQTFADEMQSPTMDSPFGTRQVCCAFDHLRSCIKSAIEDKCGDNTDGVIDKLITITINTYKTLALNDRCNQWMFKGIPASVVCLPDFLFIIITIGLLLLSLMVCCQVMNMLCSCGHRSGPRRRNSISFVLLPEHNRPLNK